MLARYHPRLALACSFQKEEAVLIDMLIKLEPAARVFTIDTGALFPETYQAWRELEAHYGVRVEVFDAADPLGIPWSATRCCSERKVAALDLALDELDGWITGLRREQARPAPARASSSSIRAAASIKPIRWPIGPTRRSGTTSATTAFPTTRCTIPRLRVNRLRALHAAWERPRRSLGGQRQGRVLGLHLGD